MAFDPLSAASSYLFSQAIDKISEETGMKERGSKIWSGLLNMFGPKEAMAGDTGPASAAAGFAPVQPQAPYVRPSAPQSGLQVELMQAPPRAEITPPGGDFTGPVQNMPLSETQVLNLPSRDVTEVDLTRPAYNRPAQQVPADQMTDIQMRMQEIALQDADDLLQMGLKTPAQVGNAANQDPGIFNKVKKYLNNEESMAYLVMALNTLRDKPDATIAAAMQKRIETAGARRQANRTADYLESIGQSQAADLIRKNPSMAADILKEYTMGGTTGFRTLEARARAAGLEPGTEAYKQFMLRGGESALSGQFGTIPAGMQLVEVDGAVRLVPIPGGEAERKQAEEARQRQTQQELAGRAGGVVFEDIGRLEKLVSEDPILNPVLGVTGAIASFIPGTNRVNAESLAQTIRANIGFDRLQQMREASPTGGALGQVSNQELSTLQSVLGNLSLSQSQDQVLQNLDRLKKIYADILKKAQAYPNASDFGFSPAPQEAATNDPLGIL